MIRLRSCFIACVLFLLANAFVFTGFAADESSAASAISEAEADVAAAYEAVLEAEQAGGDVIGLLDELTEAGQFLGAAQMSYRNGDFDNAIYFANLSRNMGDEVKSEADELWISAWDASFQRMWIMIIGSVSGVTLVILGSLLFWRSFKRRYTRRVLKMKPEVA